MSERRLEAQHGKAGGPTDTASSTEPLPAGSPSASSEPGTRSERRVKRTAVRKRQQRKRLAAGAGVVLLAILVAVVAPILLSDDAGADRASSQFSATTSVVEPSAAQDFGESQDGEPAVPGSETTSQVGSAGPSTTYLSATGISDEADSSSQPPITSPVRLSAGPTSPGVAVFVTEGGTLAAVVVLQPVEQGGVAVGVPAMTLVRTVRGFETMAGLYGAGDTDALISGLGSILALAPVAGGSAEGRALEEVVSAPETAVESTGTQAGSYAARRYAQAVLELARLAAGQQDRWTEVIAGGDAPAALEVVSAAVADDPGKDWQAAVLPGRPVTTSEPGYFDTDMSAARQLVSHILVLGGAEILLSVQNGSGAVGAAEAAAASLAPMNCTMLPFSNAPGFPDVESTVISAGPGAAAAAQQVWTLLGVGDVTEDESLASGNVVVVVGKDLDASLPRLSAARGVFLVGGGEEGS